MNTQTRENTCFAHGKDKPCDLCSFEQAREEMQPPTVDQLWHQQQRRFGQTSSLNLRKSIFACELRIRQHLLYQNWQAIKVDADHAAEMDAELRQRHNEERFPERKRKAVRA